MKSEEGTLHFYCDDQTNVRALLNLNQQYLNSEDIITKKILSDHPTMQVVQFGIWHCTDLKFRNIVKIEAKESNFKDHMEADKTDFLKKLGEKVTFLSLRSISGIEWLPDSIGKLEDLRILDLRACHNFKILPHKQRIKSRNILGLEFRQQKWFKNLTYLDISECFLLDYMPKWICRLSNLEVLKGFVANNVSKGKELCRLNDLSQLKKLRKLSIKIAMHLDLEDLSGLKPLENLSVLTLIWCINKLSGGENNGSGNVSTILLPKNLEKLDIRCYPEAEAQEMLNSTELQKLKRLYIRGGKLTKIGNKLGWKIEILRLRYLKYLNFNMYSLGSIFTKLRHVEYEHCLNLKYFPKKLSYWSKETDGPLPSINDDPTPELLIDERVQLTITKNNTALLASHEQVMMLELTGWDSISDRPGLDLVLVLDVGCQMDKNMIIELKTAMLFVIKKLSSIDRLSIVLFADKAKIVYPLSPVKNSQKELETLVADLKATSYDAEFLDGLEMGLEVIKDHINSCGRVASIMLLSTFKFRVPFDDIPRIYDVVIPVIGSVAVHTFCLSRDGANMEILKDIVHKSMGGTISDLSIEKNLTKAFSVCLAGLLTVAVQDLTLTISPVIKKSELRKVLAGRYMQLEGEADGSVTIKFGNLYSKEVRKILVYLQLPDTDKECDSEVLKISCSYKTKEVLFATEPVIVNVSRVAKVSAYQQQEPPQVKVEANRREIVEMIRAAVAAPLSTGRRAIVNARNFLKNLVNKDPEFDALFELMWGKLVELSNWMESSHARNWMNKLERTFPYSLLTSHDTQRTAIRGTKAEKSLIFSTPAMVNFLKQAEKF